MTDNGPDPDFWNARVQIGTTTDGAPYWDQEPQGNLTRWALPAAERSLRVDVQRGGPDKTTATVELPSEWARKVVIVPDEAGDALVRAKLREQATERTRLFLDRRLDEILRTGRRSGVGGAWPRLRPQHTTAEEFGAADD
ncbi:hypothetical protein ACFWNL_18145 [Kitasatospora sp. NPDC058397]|uniref:hypothetical protein n=1 Tax=unclassified Kitasatospora TaxID=2633591 RepID=UPI0036605C02